VSAAVEADWKPPAGFRRLEVEPNPFLELVGPLYGRLEGGEFTLGFRVERDHCNPAGTCHGGMMMTLADMVLILGSNFQADLQRYLNTVSATCDFLGPAPEGSWLEGRAQVLRVTRSLVFAQATLAREGSIVLRTSGILKPVGDPDPRLGPDRWFG
jgi:uncharacterized protein (TIGR00369 family)